MTKTTNNTSKSARRIASTLLAVLLVSSASFAAAGGNGGGSSSSTKGPGFKLSGDATEVLRPGGSSPLNVAISNPNKFAVKVTAITAVSVKSVTPASPSFTCTIANFKISRQYSGAYPITVPANGKVTLSGLGISPRYWPKLEMLNLNSNQNGCKNATLTFDYSGSATK